MLNSCLFLLIFRSYLQYAIDFAPFFCYTSFMDQVKAVNQYFFKKPELMCCKYAVGSPHPDEDVSFNYLNVAFPYLHFHDHWEILVVLNKSINHTMNDKSFTMKSGDVCLIRPNDAHYFTFGDSKDVKTVSFLLKKEYAKKIFSVYDEKLYDEITGLPNNLTEKLSPSFLSNILPVVLSVKSNVLNAEDRLRQTKIIINHILDKFILSYFGLKEQNPDWFNDFLTTLDTPFLDFENVAALAEKTPYSYSRLSRIFKERTGYTIIEYLTSVKINYAKEALLYTDKTVMETAQDLGYSSISHFNRTFKKRTGVSPREYKSQNSSRKKSKSRSRKTHE